MRKNDFFELLGELDDDIIKEAKMPVKMRKNFKVFKISAIAAALVMALAIPSAVYAIETVRYNAAVEYLRSLNIDVVDLSDYSRKEIIKAVDFYEAGEDSIIKDLLPDDSSEVPPQEPTGVTSEQVRQLTPTMTVRDVTNTLGETVDVGSGIYIMVYKVDDLYTLTIPFAGDDAQLGVSGEDLLKALQPIE